MPTSPAAPKDIPSVDRLLRRPELADLLAQHGHQLLAAQARRLLEDCRQRALRGDLDRADLSPAVLAAALTEAVTQRLASRLRRVFNLTGTVIHTNLGRALLADAALEPLLELMSAPNNLEYRLADGGRGDEGGQPPGAGGRPGHDFGHSASSIVC